VSMCLVHTTPASLVAAVVK